MAALVKCVFCGKKFDREKEKFQKIGRRYAHIGCNEAKGHSPFTILQYMTELFGDDYNIPLVTSQIKKYVREGATHEGIYDALRYWYEIKRETRKGEGIGIVPYIYKEAKAYWEKINKKVEFPEQERVVVTVKPKKRKKIALVPEWEGDADDTKL